MGNCDMNNDCIYRNNVTRKTFPTNSNGTHIQLPLDVYNTKTKTKTNEKEKKKNYKRKK